MKTYKTINARINYLTIIIVSILFFYTTNLHAQDAVAATGGEVSGTGGTVSYTVGQVAYSTNTGVDNTVIEGVQQPYEISVITALYDSYDDIELSISPNPATNFLTLKAAHTKRINLKYQLYDVHTKLLKSGLITENNNISIKIDKLPASTYFLSIIDHETIIKTFKIIKKQ